MSVQEVKQLHDRYVDLSNRFKASWTFHQFLQGLHKLLMDGEFGQSSADFQAVYGLLKEVSQNLNSSAVERVKSELDMAERRLQGLNRLLLQEDSKVHPSLLRLFFQRVRNYNDSIVLQLVKFFLYAHPSLDWTQDYNDKVDFLVTKVAEEAQGPNGPWVLRSRGQMKEIAESLFALVHPDGSLSEDEIARKRQGVDDHRRGITSTDSFDELIEHGLIRGYREFKAQLGTLFFHPEILMPIVETNLELRNHIQSLYRREEQRIVADYQRIFELEKEVSPDPALDMELESFREQVESFEKSLQNESLSLDELGRLRQHVRELIPRLTGLKEGEELFSKSGSIQAITNSELEPDEPTGEAPQPTVAGWDRELLTDYRRQISSALDGINADEPVDRAVLSPDLFGFRLEPREITAYRRLVAEEEPAHRSLEDFLVWAAALRVRAYEESEEIRGILDDTAITKDAPVFVRARLTLRVADLFLRRFDHEIEQLLHHETEEDAQDLLVSKMRLMREYSGLWLHVYKR